MKATVRARLTIGFLSLLAVGSAASVLILSMLSHVVEDLQNVVSVSDATELKAMEMRYDMLTMSDAMRGYLVNPESEGERARKKRADDEFEADVQDMRKLAAGGDVLPLLDSAARMDADTLNPIEDQILA